jgi:hypothetical protein
MHTQSSALAFTNRADPAPLIIPPHAESVWELYERIVPVAIIYGNGRRLEVAEFNSANRLLKELWRIGRHRLRVRGAICAAGALTPANVSAFNCYLEHHFAAQSHNAIRCQLHRFRWYEMQRSVPLVWIR